MIPRVGVRSVRCATLRGALNAKGFCVPSVDRVLVKARPFQLMQMSARSAAGGGRADEGGWCDGPEHAALYAAFRPEPPQNLINFIVEWMRKTRPSGNNRALDVGCGTGQSTRTLSGHFQEIIGVDVSKSQIEEAKRRVETSNIAYHVIEPDCFPVDSGSCDLVIAVQACHWFDLPKFFKEADRVLAPGGTLAVAGYNLPAIELASQPKSEHCLKELFLDFYEETRPFWREERRHIENEYEEIVLPYPDVFRMKTDEALENSFYQLQTTSMANFRGYLRSWTGFRNYAKAQQSGDGERRLEKLCQRMAEACGISSEQLEKEVLHLKFPYFFRFGRKPGDQ